jgi:hypothetical protein
MMELALSGRARRVEGQADLPREPIAPCVEHAIVGGNATEPRRKMAVLRPPRASYFSAQN